MFRIIGVASKPALWPAAIAAPAIAYLAWRGRTAAALLIGAAVYYLWISGNWPARREA